MKYVIKDQPQSKAPAIEGTIELRIIINGDGEPSFVVKNIETGVERMLVHFNKGGYHNLDGSPMDYAAFYPQGCFDVGIGGHLF